MNRLRSARPAGSDGESRSRRWHEVNGESRTCGWHGVGGGSRFRKRRGITGAGAIVFAACLLWAGLAGSTWASEPPKAGDAAPDLRLPYATADTIIAQGPSLLEAVKEGPILLAFYPADWSPGCTKEVCTLRDSFAELGRLKVTVWGISGDNPYSHRAWAEHHQLPFRLLSDMKHEAANAYGSFNAASGFNRRSVFVVDRSGKIAYADPEYSVADDADFEALKAALAKLQ